MSLHFSRQNQPALLDVAAKLTRSTGWKSDAVAFGVFADNALTDLRAVAVFQNIDALGAEFHFAMAEGRHLGAEIVKGISALALHPRGMNLPVVWAHIPDWNVVAQVAALKCGFAFEFRKRAGAADGSDAIVLRIARMEPRLDAAEPITEAADAA